MIRKFNFIYKGKLIDVYAASFKEAKTKAKVIFEELDKLEDNEKLIE